MPLANRRTQTNTAGQVVLKPGTSWCNGTTHLFILPLEFMLRLAALVPEANREHSDARFKLPDFPIRYPRWLETFNSSPRRPAVQCALARMAAADVDRDWEVSANCSRAPVAACG